MSKILDIGIIDLVSKKPTNKLFAKIMNANFASIMPLFEEFLRRIFFGTFS